MIVDVCVDRGKLVYRHVHLVEMPAPLPEAAHPPDPLSLDVSGGHRANPVPPMSQGLVAESMPRSTSRFSTFRRLSGKRTYIITISRMTSGDELKNSETDWPASWVWASHCHTFAASAVSQVHLL